jgi:hypothetical protein
MFDLDRHQNDTDLQHCKKFDYPFVISILSLKT